MEIVISSGSVSPGMLSWPGRTTTVGSFTVRSPITTFSGSDSSAGFCGVLGIRSIAFLKLSVPPLFSTTNFGWLSVMFDTRTGSPRSSLTFAFTSAWPSMNICGAWNPWGEAMRRSLRLTCPPNTETWARFSSVFRLSCAVACFSIVRLTMGSR